MIKDRKGIISIFLALIIMPVYLVSIVSIDLARVYSASNYLKMANFNLVKSGLLNYEEEFFDKYKILSIDKNNPELEKLSNEIPKLNLENQYGNEGLINPISFKTNIDFKEEDSLLNTINIENQIVELMKYKAPMLLADGFMNLVGMAKTSKTYNEALSKKMDYHESLDAFERNSYQLGDLLKKYSENSKKINELTPRFKSNMRSYYRENKKVQDLISIYKPLNLDYSKKTLEELDQIFQANYSEALFIQLVDLVENYSDQAYNADKYSNLFSRVKNRVDKILEVLKYKNFIRTIEIENEEYSLSNILNEVNANRTSILNKLNNQVYGQEIIDNYKQAYDIIVDQKNILNSLIIEIEKIQTESQRLNNSLDIWKNSINEIDDESIKNQMRTEFEFTNKVFSKENIDSILNQLDRDKKSMDILSSNLNYTSEASSISRIVGLDEGGFNTEIYKSYDQANPINNLESFAIFKRFVIELAQDANLPQVDKDQANETRKKLLEFNKNNNKQVNEKKDLGDYISTEDLNSILGYEFSTNLADQASYADVSLDSKDSISQYLEKSNQELTFGSAVNDMLENLLIAQYISDMFSGKLMNKQGEFVSQKEYILFGDQSLSKNTSKVNAVIFGLRLGLNSIYAYTSPQIQMETLQIASAIGGSTLIGIPIIQNLLIFGLGFGESLIDMTRLNDSKDVATFKNQSSWQLSLTGLTKLAIESASDLAKDSIENVYDNAESIAIDIVEGSEDKLNSYINQSIDSISQDISASIITPLQNKVVSLITDPVSDAKASIVQFFGDLESQISMDKNDLTRSLKQEMLAYIRDNYVNQLVSLIENYKQGANNILIETFNQIKLRVESSIKSKVGSYGYELKKEIRDKLSASKEGAKEKVSQSIENYLSKFSTNEEENLNSISSSLLSFDYDDYVKLMIFLGLNTYKKSDMLQRMLVVMDIEMKRINQEFSIIKQYVAIESIVEVDLITISGFIESKGGRKKLNEKIKIGY